MLSKRLEALSKDPSNPDSIAELVVTALGPQGSFYICWKTVSGRHEQDSHGLPAALHEWLFPQDGSRRDVETLQVILGPREGEFFASDRHGKRDQKPTEPAVPQQQQQQSPLAGRLRRASTLWQQQQQQRDPANRKRLSFIEDPEAQPPAAAAATATTTAANKRLSFIGDPAAEAKGNRRRSATLSSLGWASSSRRTLSLPKVPLDPAEPEDQRRARRTTLLPLALQAGGPAPFASSSNSNSSSNNISRETAATTAATAASVSRRSTSPPSRGPSRAGSLRASASSHSLNSVASRESAGNFSPERRRTPPRPSIPEEEPSPNTPRPSPPRRPVSVYADACIQTDPVPATAEDDALSDYQHHHYNDGGFGGAARRARGMSTASEASSVFSRAATDTSSRRTSMASDIKIDPAVAAPCWLEQQQQEQQQEEQLYHQQQQQWEANNFNPNPVVMGRMQDYFRSPAYCLGDAFRPTLGSGMYWGSWRQ